MSSIIAETSPPAAHRAPLVTDFDHWRATKGMLLFIATEAALFAMLFFTYFFLGSHNPKWPPDTLPKLPPALIMLGVLITSSIVLQFGERQATRERYGAARALLLVTIAMGLVFLIIQFFEYRDHLRILSPRSDAYGSIFYTITSFHAAHVIVGLLMLGYVAILPGAREVERASRWPYHNATLYWHFVDVVWIFVVAILYIGPHL